MSNYTFQVVQSTSTKVLVNTFLGGFIAGLCVFTIAYFSRTIFLWVRRRMGDPPREFTSDQDYILTLVVRSDIPLIKSKMSIHCSRASVTAFDNLLSLNPDAARFWQSTGQGNVVVSGECIHTLNRLDDFARRLDLPTTFVCDDRGSLIGPQPATVLAIGPGPKNIVHRITHDLRAL